MYSQSKHVFDSSFTFSPFKKILDSTVISNFFKPLKTEYFHLHFIKNKASEQFFKRVVHKHAIL